MEAPRNGWFRKEHTKKWMITLGYPDFRKPPTIFGSPKATVCFSNSSALIPSQARNPKWHRPVLLPNPTVD